jgi:hypothetical protein
MNNTCRKVTFVGVVDVGFTVHCCWNSVGLVYSILFCSVPLMQMPCYLWCFRYNHRIVKSDY